MSAPAPTAPVAAILQMTSGIDPDANLAHIASAMAEASAHGAAMILLPEMSLLLDKNRQRAAPHISLEADSPHLQALQNLARHHKIWLHTGSIAYLTDDGQRRVNRSHVIDDQGVIQARYDKIHMFDVRLHTGENWSESALYDGGNQAVVVDTPLGKMGLSICFDLRFPELYRDLVGQGAEIITIPAAFTVPTGEAHWHVLMRARAIETACHVISPAQAGTHEDGRSTYGHSLAIAPWGEVLADAGPSGDDSAPYRLIYAAIDAEKTAKARSAIPLAQSRKLRGITL